MLLCKSALFISLFLVSQGPDYIGETMSANDVLKVIKDKEIEYVDLRFTDPRGKLQHVTMDGKMVDEGMLNEGIFFDGSSIAGWKAINESDMILKPDLSRTVIDPFTSHNTLNLFCDVLDAIKKIHMTEILEELQKKLKHI